MSYHLWREILATLVFLERIVSLGQVATWSDSTSATTLGAIRIIAGDERRGEVRSFPEAGQPPRNPQLESWERAERLRHQKITMAHESPRQGRHGQQATGAGTPSSVGPMWDRSRFGDSEA